MSRWILPLLFLVSCATRTPPASENAATTSSEAAPKGLSCEKEVAKVCAEPLKDGCLVEIEGAPATMVHRCIQPASDAPPCTQEIARQCPDGLKDACLESPAISKYHLCVETGS